MELNYYDKNMYKNPNNTLYKKNDGVHNIFRNNKYKKYNDEKNDGVHNIFRNDKYKKYNDGVHNIFRNNKYKKYNDGKNAVYPNSFPINKKTFNVNKPVLNKTINVKTTKLNNPNILDEIIKLKTIAKNLKMDMIKTELEYDIEFPFNYPVNNACLSLYTQETQKIILNDLISEMTNLNSMVKMLF